MRLLACLIVLAAFISIGLRAEEPAPPAPDFPSFAVARLTLKEFGGSFDKLHAFGNRIVANGGALTKQGAQNLLFNIPVDEGLDGMRPAEIFSVDPAVGGAWGELAMILPLADAKVFETALTASLDCKKKGEAWQVAIPQGLGQPDKNQFVTVKGGWVYVTSTPELAQELEKWVNTAGLPAPGVNEAVLQAWTKQKATLSDARFSINLESLWKQHRDQVKPLLALAGTLGIKLPGGGTGTSGLSPTTEETLGSFKRVDLDVNFVGTELQLQLKVLALETSPLATELNDESKGLAPEASKYIPDEAVLSAQIKTRYLEYLAQNSWKLAEPRLKNRMGGAAPTANDTIWPLQALLNQTGGEKREGDIVASLSTTLDGGFTALAGVLAKDPAKALPAFPPVFTQYVKLSSKIQMAAAENPQGEPPIALKDVGTTEVLRAPNAAQQVELNGSLTPNAECAAAMKRLIELPILLRTAAGKDAVLMTAGRESSEKMKSALELVDKPKTEPVGPQEGALIQLNFRPVGLLRSYFLVREDEDAVQGRPILAAIKDDVIGLRFGVKDGAAWMFVKVPAPALQGVVQSIFRLGAAGIDITGKLRKNPRALQGTENVPAPAPAQ